MNFTRAVAVARFILVLLCIALILTIAVFGVDIWKFQSKGVFEEGTIILGLDLSGGSIITFSAKTEDTGMTLSKNMDSIVSAMRSRLDNAGYTEANCYKVGSDKLTIEIPGISDPNEAVDMFGSTAKLTFRDHNGNVVMDADDVKSAGNFYSQESDNPGWFVQLNFTNSGSDKFAEVTKNAAGQADENNRYISIYMDEELISKPSVDKEYATSGITGGTAQISQPGGMDESYARTLAGNINAGALAYDLELEELRAIGPTLGEKSLSTSIVAGGIGILLVMIFMIIFYRMPGVLASIALVAYLAIFGLALSIFGANLTLPGIAGIVLSVGMAVDANVIIFERIKEEIKSGKTAKAAVKNGFSRAFSAVLDSNITTFIAAGVLFVMGSGTIQGFAVTLGLGVVISFITAIFLTRLLLNLACDMNWTKISLYGVKERSEA